ncbi:transglutaminase [Sphaerisporangium rufum]|uniref:Transglutaminase n=1 Tax=Sphaerisporangium rufum TaxID=1381558 RepID=A0A919UZZ6_9ACTN|nr:DUF3488 and transglutaminase-like domain-containing protein [Sphaerisporangium rufum]GII76827.1 transglutaminase [Sphaerisporangium rufum]
MRLPIAAGLATAAVSITLYPLFSALDWFWAGLGAILVVTTVSALTFRRTVPRWAGPPLALLALLVYLVAVFAGDQAWLRFIPNLRAADALAALLGEGFDAIQRYAAPVPPRPGVLLLTTAGIGLIALLADVLAVRLRRAALAGLPLLALFTVPAAVLSDPIGWPAFIAGALGYIGLLIADGRERVGQWGRAVLVRRPRAGGTARADAAPLALTGKRIGVTAIVLAVGLPALLPTLAPNPLFGFGVGSGNGPGGNTITIPNPIASLRGQLTQPVNAVVLSYRSDDNASRYLRMYSLDTFDGDQWTMSQPKGRPENRVSAGPLPAPPGLGQGTPVKAYSSELLVSEEVEGLSFLPLPYPVTSVQIEGDWRADESTLMVFSTHDTAGGRRYTVSGQEPRPSYEELRQAAGAPDEGLAERYLRLPGDLPRRIRALADQAAGDAATPYEKAVRLQRWFTTEGGFTYSLRTQGNGNDALVEFLRNRAGYCEQFAAAMAVMARTLGIPARVAIGYTGGTGVNGLWQVRTHDLHAWPELYFDQVGWLRFEPTPAGGIGQATAQVPDYSQPPASATGEEEDGRTTPSAGPNDQDAEDAVAAQRAPRDPDAVTGGQPALAEEGVPAGAKIGLGALGALLIALAPAAWRALTRRRRRAAWTRGGPAGASAAGAATAAGPAPSLGRAVHGTWRELADTLEDLGLGHDPGDSPRALARRLVERHELDAETSAALTRIAMAEERLRYARTPGAISPLTGDLRRVRRALRATVSRGRRLRSVLLPASTLRRLRQAGGRVLDGFDRLEMIRLWPSRRGDDGRAQAPAETRERVPAGR